MATSTKDVMLTVVQPPEPPESGVAWLDGVPLFTWIDIPNSRMLTTAAGMGLSPDYFAEIGITIPTPANPEFSWGPNKFGEHHPSHDKENWYQDRYGYGGTFLDDGRYTGQPSWINPGIGDANWPDNTVVRFVFGVDSPFWDVALLGCNKSEFKVGNPSTEPGSPGYPNGMIPARARINSFAYTTADRIRVSRTTGLGAVTVGNGSTTTQVIAASIVPPGTADNQFNAKWMTFGADTATAALRGKSFEITKYTHTTSTFAVRTLPAVPVAGDTATLGDYFTMVYQCSTPGTSAAVFPGVAAPQYPGIAGTVQDGTAVFTFMAVWASLNNPDWQSLNVSPQPGVIPGDDGRNERMYDGTPRGGHPYWDMGFLGQRNWVIKFRSKQFWPTDAGNGMIAPWVGNLTTRQWDRTGTLMQNMVDAGIGDTETQPPRFKDLLTEDYFGFTLGKIWKFSQQTLTFTVLCNMGNSVQFNRFVGANNWQDKYGIAIGDPGGSLGPYPCWLAFPTNGETFSAPTKLTLTGPAASQLMALIPSQAASMGQGFLWCPDLQKFLMILYDPGRPTFTLTRSGNNLIAEVLATQGEYNTSGRHDGGIMTTWHYVPQLNGVIYRQADVRPMKFMRTGPVADIYARRRDIRRSFLRID